MQAPQPSMFGSKISLPSDPRIGVSIRLIATLLAIVFFFALVFVFPVSVAAASEDRATAPDSHPGVQTPTSGRLMPWLDRGLLVLIALLFALAGLLKDFRRYRGLLPVLFSNFYSWVFITFTATCIFAVDYYVFQWPLFHRIVHAVSEPGDEEAMLHLSLVLGHTGVSAAFVYLSPFVLGFIPTQARLSPTEQSPNESGKEKPVTEMNVVYAAIRESLETSVNGRVCDWTDEYSWPVIKSTGKMLLIGLVNSGMISHTEFERAKQEEDSYHESDEFWENRQRKYELLRKMMNHTSYGDLRSRLERTARIERAGDAP
jgi:hypothetical protein